MARRKISMSNARGRIYELVVEELVKKAGFETDIQKIDSDQFPVHKGKKKKRLVGRAGTYDPDIVGKFKMPIPFSYPIMLIGECKYLNKEINPRIAREFFGAMTDVSQFPRAEIKHTSKKKYEQIFSSKRYVYVPVIFSHKGFMKNVQSFLYTHGISFISYQNSPVFDEIEKMVEKLLGSLYKTKETNQAIAKLADFEQLGGLLVDVKKEGYMKRYQKLKKYMLGLGAYISLLDDFFVVQLFVKRIKHIHRCGEAVVTLQRADDSPKSGVTLLLRRKRSTRPFGYITLPRAFYDEYKKRAKRPIIQTLAVFYEKDGKIMPHYMKLSGVN